MPCPDSHCVVPAAHVNGTEKIWKAAVMFLSDLGIDIGTANTVIYARGMGIVLNEPSVIALNNETGRLNAISKEAIEMIGRTPRNISITQPINRGVISDIHVAGDLLKMLIRRCRRIPFIKFRIARNSLHGSSEAEGDWDKGRRR